MRLSRSRAAAAPPSPAVRLLWRCCGLLLDYPDQSNCVELDAAAAALPRLDRGAASMLEPLLTQLRTEPVLEWQARYSETFDWKNRRALHLTYWTAGDTRARGMALVRFAEAYRASGVQPPDDELPDHLPVLLEFAATVDPVAGHRLLTEHAAPLTALHEALARIDSPYAPAVAAVCGTVPKPAADGLRRARQLVLAGAPVETVGLGSPLAPYPTPDPSPAPSAGAAR